MKKKLMLWTRLLSVFGVLLAMAAPVAAASFVGATALISETNPFTL